MESSWTIYLVILVLWAISTLPSGSGVQAQTCTGTWKGWYGDRCQYNCRCTNNNCDANGYCTLGSICVKGWFGPLCQYADLTSTMAVASTPGWLSDGDDSTCNPDLTATSVTITLTSAFPLTRIWINSDTTLFYSSGAVIPSISTKFRRAFGSTVYYCDGRVNRRINENTLEVQCTSSLEYEELTLVRNFGSWGSVCSVYITADPLQPCQTGKYGPTCGLDCSPGCDSHGCYKYTGQCSCKHAGFTGNTCSDCITGRYGDNCDQFCSPRCLNNDCFKDTGDCVLCNSGFTGSKCEDCIPGRYGDNCDRDCSPGCVNNECYKATGNCKSFPCKYGFTGDKCEYCITGRYGTDCDKSCNLGCQGTVCVQATGACSSGCKNEFSGTYCEDCIAGRYKYDCSLSCPINCNSVGCDRNTGYCAACRTGYYGNTCENACNQNCKYDVCDQSGGRCTNGCDVGYGGSNCDTKCNENCKNNACKQDNPARCSSNGCIDGYVAPFCTNNCPSGWYGPACGLSCPVNCKTRVCHHVNGNCTDGCKNGFSGAQCSSKCPVGMYGPGCTETCSPNCEGGECNSDNGHCTFGCTGVYTGDKCDIVCDSGTYGNGCINKCSQNCKDGDCHPRTGHCDGCIDGYTGDMCGDECGNKTYGPQCSQTCSVNCIDNSTTTGPCSHITGFCLQGCTEGFSGKFCEAIPPDDDILPAAIGGAVVAAVLVIILIVVVVFLCRKRKRGKEDRSYMAENRVVEGREAKKENGNVFTDPESPNLPESANKTQASPPSAEEVDEEDGIQNVDDAAVASTSITTAAVTPKLQPKPKPSSKEKPKHKPKPPAKPNKLAMMLKGKGGKVKKSPYYNTMISQSKTAIAVEELDSFMASKTKDFFQDQFKSIPNNEKATTKDAQSDENRAKNRYKNICAYDHSRVHLKINKDKQQGDYINASYIDGYKGEEKFIASQGPTTININDFARMLWEQEVEKVVMLTNLVEVGKVKCERYWPEEDGGLEFGDIKISLLTTEVFADYTIRRLQLYNQQAGEETRTVTHYHFTSWPDKDVPTTPWGLVDFEQRVAAQATDKPIVVHCSAGVGRTGTFIALRNVMKQAEDTGYVDFFAIVELQRKDRVNMVQTAEQYEFLHRVAYIAIVCMGTTVTGGAIQERIAELEARADTGQTFMEKEFKSVCGVCEEANDSGDEDDGEEFSNVYQNSRKVVNRMKNRFANILPKEYYRVRLLCTDGNMEDYINAVFTPSFRKQDQQILTQLPLATTVTDFWRMVSNYKVSLIVAFDLDTKDTDKTFGDYLPDEETEEPLELSVCSVYVTSSTSEEFWEEQKITVTPSGKWKEKLKAAGKQTEGGHQVTHMACLTTDLDATNLLTLIQHIRSLRPDGEGRTVYMCRNGADYSGLVCVLSLLLDRLDSDHHLTVPLVVGAIKAIRPQVIPNLEQYKLLYQVLKIYKESSNVYCNFK